MILNPKLERLITKYIEERCSPAELEELGEHLMSSAEARDFFLETILLHEHLDDFPPHAGPGAKNLRKSSEAGGTPALLEPARKVFTHDPDLFE